LISEGTTITTSESLEPDRLRTIRRLMLLLLLVAMIGTAIDLMLLNHHEDVWQMVPLGVIALGVVSAVAAARGGRRAVALMRVVMGLFVVAGLLGIGLHYLGNREFQREMDPGLQGWNLLVKVVTAKAPPALAPVAMIQIGLLGLLFTYQHPALGRPESERSGA
jgi:hypothetical protein